MPLELPNNNFSRRIANKLVRAIESAGGEIYQKADGTFLDLDKVGNISLRFPESNIIIAIFSDYMITVRDQHDQYELYHISRTHNSIKDDQGLFTIICGEEHELDLSPIVNHVIAKMK